MSSEFVLVLVGWVLGVLTSLGIAIFQFWLDGKRELRNLRSTQRRDDIRMARNWYADGKLYSLRGFDLREANLAGKNLSGADLEDADLEGANLEATNLCGANLRKASFRRAAIRGVDFRNAKMWATDFTDASVESSDFSGADIEDAMLIDAQRIVACKWDAVKTNDATRLPKSIAAEISLSIEVDSCVDRDDRRS